MSCRQYVYGPGEDGIHVEYLYRSPGTSSELLVARSGAVSNRGGNFFQLDFTAPLAAYEADSVKGGDGTFDALATGVPLEGQAPQSSGKSTGLELQARAVWPAPAPAHRCGTRTRIQRPPSSLPSPASDNLPE